MVMLTPKGRDVILRVSRIATRRASGLGCAEGEGERAEKGEKKGKSGEGKDGQTGRGGRGRGRGCELVSSTH